MKIIFLTILISSLAFGQEYKCTKWFITSWYATNPPIPADSECVDSVHVDKPVFDFDTLSHKDLPASVVVKNVDEMISIINYYSEHGYEFYKTIYLDGQRKNETVLVFRRKK